MVWLAFALLGNFFFTLTNVVDQVLRKNHIRHDSSLTVLWMLCFSFIWLAILPFIEITVPPWPQLLAAVAAGFIAVLTAVPYFYTLSIEEASRVIPVWQFSSLFVLVFATLLLGETLEAGHYYGFAAMFIGGLLLGIDRTTKGFRLNKAVLIVLAASVAWAIHLLLMKFFYISGTFWNGFFWIYIGNFLGTVVLLAMPRNFARAKSELAGMTGKGAALLVVSTVLTFLSELFLLLAVKHGPVALVSVVGGTSMMFLFIITLVLSRYFPKVLKERIDRGVLATKLVAILFMLVGVYLIG